jgi:hypothetical protein
MHLCCRRVTSLLALLVGVLGTWLGGIFLLHAPGPVAQPVPDRWHRKATPLTGGLALLVGFLLALSVGVVEHDADRRFGYVAIGVTAAVLAIVVGARYLVHSEFAADLERPRDVRVEPSRVYVADWRGKATPPRVARRTTDYGTGQRSGSDDARMLSHQLRRIGSQR